MLLLNKLERLEISRKWEKLKENSNNFEFVSDAIKDTDNLLVRYLSR